DFGSREVGKLCEICEQVFRTECEAEFDPWRLLLRSLLDDLADALYERHVTSPFVPGTSVRIAGASSGPLAGLTFAAKDLFDVAGHPTGGGNPDWSKQHPIPTTHAWAVQRLLD